MMSHHMSKPCETLPCSPDFHDILLAQATFHSHWTPYVIYNIPWYYIKSLLYTVPGKSPGRNSETAFFLGLVGFRMKINEARLLGDRRKITQTRAVTFVNFLIQKQYNPWGSSIGKIMNMKSNKNITLNDISLLVARSWTYQIKLSRRYRAKS